MIVVDASAMVEGLVGRDPDDALLAGLTGEIAAPHLLDAEVLSVLRGLELGRKLTPQAADEARRDYFDFTLLRYPVEPLAERVWALRHQFTTYDACYLALAEAIDAPVYTCDARLKSAGHRATVELFGTTHSPRSGAGVGPPL
jgi:predicted nucleic acid-binding protein